ncbi:uncharacterized protein BDR25DRAFT_268728 [Lindgomyces ingoldianus]|uniref:Uncharacterized protein n=1 Tax=Lindgomyces ingoldianus TaxID=673940 RepID=A0ACB6QJH9_9PLEO|nr:uncharacterized protein BDR25DRAFT_268728 [Lindgomyces ingoldianus]KAF2466295.1 hypothetical protein BDR25DRAFT_268728 [Lindgomyces ingoldianus]
MELETAPYQHPIIYWHAQNPPETPSSHHQFFFQSPFPSHAPLSDTRARSNDTQSAFLVREPVIRNGSKKRRACNECKQQKLRCDLSTLVNYQSPDFCSRCKRLGLECRIDRSFRRERKRKTSDELEKEVNSLRRELSRRSTSAQATGGDVANSHQIDTISSDAGSTSSVNTFHRQSGMFSTTLPNMTSPVSTQASDPPGTTTRRFPEESPLTGRDTNPTGFIARAPRALGSIQLSADDIDELFAEYFTYYHPFLPMLDPRISPAQYYNLSVLLFWAIISVASRRYDNDPTLLTRLARSVTNLTWRTLQSIPHSKSVVQSLALLCTWPFPTSSSTLDVSYMWTGTMMQISIQMGLNRPLNPQDFAKFRVQLNDSEISERVRTWAGCNIVAQSVSVGTGLAAPVQYDWSLVSGSRSGSPAMKLDHGLEAHLRIEMFRDNVSRAMASSVSDPVGLLPTHERLSLYKVFSKELEGIEGSINDLSDTTRFYISAARLHLQSFYLFDEPSSDTYINRILTLYFTATSVMQQTLDTNQRSQNIIRYCPFFVYQTSVSASFIILKILKNDYFSSFIDVESEQKLFHASVSVIRKMSVADNDLPGRLGDVLAYLWTDTTPNLISGPGKEGLQLKIRSRMSMSVVFDSLWRWREQFRALPNNENGFDQENEGEPGISDATGTHRSIEEHPPFAPNPMLFDCVGPLDFALDNVDFSPMN